MTSRAETISRYISSKESATLLPDISDSHHDGALGGLLISKKISTPCSDTGDKNTISNKNCLDASRSNGALMGKGPPKHSTSPVRLRRTTVTDADADADAVKMNARISLSGRTAVEDIARENVAEKPASLPLRSLSGGGSRGDPSVSQTRSSYNSLKKSKIPGPIRRSLDQNLTPLTSTGEVGGELDASRVKLGTSGDGGGGGGSSRGLVNVDDGLGLLKKSTTSIALDMSGIALGGKSEKSASKGTKTNDREERALTAGAYVSDPDVPTSSSLSSSSSPRKNSTSTMRTSTNTSIEHAASFQAACKARVASQKKSLQSAFFAAAGSAGGHRGLSAKDTRTVLRESAAASEADAKQRKRAEIYAINNFLKQREMERYAAFQAEQHRLLNSDDISWCSADSSLMPTPRYRSEKERRYDPAAASPSRASKAKSMGGV